MCGSIEIWIVQWEQSCFATCESYVQMDCDVIELVLQEFLFYGMLLALAIWNPQFLCRWGTRCPVFAHWMFCLCRIVSMVGTDGKLMWPLTLWMVQPFWMFPEVLHMSVILDAVFCMANNWNNWAAAGLSCIGWFLSTFTEGMHFALSEWDPWLNTNGGLCSLCVCDLDALS